jgi:type VI secretion system Hcp family effector
MAADFYLEIVTKKGGKIKGETMSNACPEQIDVSKFTIGMTSPTDFDGQATGRVQLEHAEFEFPTSLATTPLFQTICTNDVIKTATLTCRMADGKGKDQTFLQWRFRDAKLVSFKMVGENDDTNDTIKISYAGVEIAYRQQKQDGTFTTPLSAFYDSGSNTMGKPTVTC